MSLAYDFYESRSGSAKSGRGGSYEVISCTYLTDDLFGKFNISGKIRGVGSALAQSKRSDRSLKFLLYLSLQSCNLIQKRLES